MVTEPIEIDAPPGAFVMGSLAVKIRAVAGNGATVDQKCEMLGPYTSRRQPSLHQENPMKSDHNGSFPRRVPGVGR